MSFLLNSNLLLNRRLQAEMSDCSWTKFNPNSYGSAHPHVVRSSDRNRAQHHASKINLHLLNRLTTTWTTWKQNVITSCLITCRLISASFHGCVHLAWLNLFVELAQICFVSVTHRLHVFSNSRVGHHFRQNIWDSWKLQWCTHRRAKGARDQACRKASKWGLWKARNSTFPSDRTSWGQKVMRPSRGPGNPDH